MNNPALKGEVSSNKMRSKIKPRLRRADVVLNSFTSCVSNAPEELSGTPEVSFPKVISQPGMFVQKFKGGIAFKQLKCFANTHGCWHLDEKMHMVNSNVQLINTKAMSFSNFMDESLTIHPNPIELQRVSGVLRLPHKVEGVLPEGMFGALQIHFFPPSKPTRNRAHANFVNLFQRGSKSEPLCDTQNIELNLMGDGNSSLGFKAEVSLPLM